MSLRSNVLACAGVLALTALAPGEVSADFQGTDSFTYTFRALTVKVVITAADDPNQAKVEAYVTLPEIGDEVLAFAAGQAVDLGSPRGRPLRGRITSLQLVDGNGETQTAFLPKAARRAFGARSNAQLARTFARRTARVIYQLYGDFFGLDD